MSSYIAYIILVYVINITLVYILDEVEYNIFKTQSKNIDMAIVPFGIFQTWHLWTHYVRDTHVNLGYIIPT